MSDLCHGLTGAWLQLLDALLALLEVPRQVVTGVRSTCCRECRAVSIGGSCDPS